MDKLLTILLYLGLNLFNPFNKDITSNDVDKQSSDTIVIDEKAIDKEQKQKEKQEQEPKEKQEIKKEDDIDITSTEENKIEDKNYEKYLEYKNQNNFVPIEEAISLTEGNEFCVELEEEANSNYKWIYVINDESLLELVEERTFELADNDKNHNQKVFKFRALKSGTAKIKFYYYDKGTETEIANNTSVPDINTDEDSIILKDYDFNVGKTNVEFAEKTDSIELDATFIVPDTYNKRLEEYEFYKKSTNFSNSEDPKTLQIGESISIELDENPRDGYQWYYNIQDYTIVKLIDDRFFYLGEDNLMITENGKRIFKFKGLKKGKTTVLLKYHKEADRSYDVMNEMKIEFEVK